MSRTNDIILSSPLLPIVGVITSVIGIAAFFLPWSSVGGYTGLDFLTGNTDFSGFQAYLPSIALILMVIILAISVMGVRDKGRRMTFYGVIIFGFVTLLVIVLFGNWSPMEDYKLLTNGGTGFYLAMAMAIVYFLAGVTGYSVRPLPPPPQKPYQNQTRR